MASLLLAAVTLTVSSPAAAQCSPAWQLGPNTEGMPGVQGNVLVRALAELPDGRLVAAGAFTGAGGRPALRVAIWDGKEWFPLGAGLEGTGAAVFALAAMPDGAIIAGGTFQTSGGAINLARWDGLLWRPLSGGSPDESVTALHVSPNGLLVIGGDFHHIGTLEAHRVATWDGTSFQALGPGLGLGNVRQLGTLPDGRIVAAGDFTSPVAHLAVWESTDWQTLGPPLQVGVGSMAITPAGDIVVNGTFVGSAPGEQSSFAMLQGGMWIPLGRRSDTDATFGLAFDRALGVVAGAVSNLAGFEHGETVVRWTGARWEPLGPPTSGTVYTLLGLRDGGFLVGGSFTQMGNTNQGSGGFANGVARYGIQKLPRPVVRPASLSLISGNAVTFVADTPEPGSSYRWEIERTPNANDWLELGPAPTTLPCGFATTTGWDTPTLSIRVSRCADGATHRVRIVRSACAESVSLPAVLTVIGACPADLDDGQGLGTPDGGVTIDDLLYFLSRFEAGC